MALVTLPNIPGNGVSKWNVAARCQSTLPVMTGTITAMNARTIDPAAIGIATRTVHLTPRRFTAVTNTTSPVATTGMDTVGSNHCWIADAARRAAIAHAGT